MKFFKTTKYRVTLLLIFALLIQMVGPIAADYVYANELEQTEIVGESDDVIAEEDDISEEQQEETEVSEEQTVDETSEEDEEETISTEDDEINEEETGTEETDNPDEEVIVEEDTGEEDVNKEEPTEGENTGEEEPKVEDDEEVEVEEEFIGPKLEGEIIPFVGDGGNELSYNVITDVELTYADGTEFEEYIDPTRLIKINYTWKIPENLEVKEGDYTIISIPKEFDVSNDLSGNLGDYGTWKLDSSTRKLELVFNNLVGQESLVSGHVELNLNLDVKIVRVDVPYEIEFPISGRSIIKEIKFEPQEGTDISKSGSWDNDNKIITWEIDINTGLKEVENGTVVDTLDSKLKYVENSMKIYELKVYSDGTVKEGSLIDEDKYNVKYENNKLSVEFIPPTVDKAYRLIYNTEIKQIDTTKDSETYTNSAEFNEEKDTDTVTVTFDPIISKEGFDPSFNKDTIDWEIKVNTAGYKLKNVVVEDTLPDGLTLDGDIKVYLSSNLVTEGITINPNSNSFKVTFPEEINDEYIIKYTTKIDQDRLENNNTSITFDNVATITQDGDSTGKPVGGSATVKYGKLINKTGKYIKGYNDEKYIDWTIDINLGELKLNEKEIIDELGSGLKLESLDDIKIYELNRVENSKNFTLGNQIFTFTISRVNSEAKGDIVDFKITFNENINRAYRIVYRTTITNKEQGTFTNTGSIGGVVGKGDTGSTTPSIQNTFNKELIKNLDYSNGIFEWQITVDPHKEGIDNLSIIDTFDDGIMMTEDQFNKIEIKKGNTKLTSGFTITRIPEEGKIKGFNIDFEDQVNDDIYRITYKTSLDPDVHTNINGETKVLTYGNKVEFLSDEKKVTEPISKAPTIKDIGKTNGNKIGILDKNTKQITWTINLNYLSKNMNNLVVTDDILGNQKLVKDSVKIYNYTVSSNGTITKGAEVNDSNFKITESEDGKSFEVKFPGEINTPYLIEYKTDMIGISQTKYENTAKTNYGNYHANVGYFEGDKFVSKTGKEIDFSKDTRRVDWTITINES